MSGATERALLYHEPAIVTILIQSSFLLLLNIGGYVLDNVIYCGLLGQVFLGVAWGTPGARWLPEAFEVAITQLGYLGLILLVFEGGLSTSIGSLRANMLLAILVALTGILLPMGFSFSLLSLGGASNLQAFAAGCALCSTSLGTTFTVLKTSGLVTTRLGTILTSAAMLDDVVGLVLVQVISNLGPAHPSFTWVTVVRPVLVSLAFATIVPLVCQFMLKPSFAVLSSRTAQIPDFLRMIARPQTVKFLLSTSLLIGLATGASYAGTSNLFAAYLAGAVISWTDELSGMKSANGIMSRASEATSSTDEHRSRERKAMAGGPDSDHGPLGGAHQERITEASRCEPFERKDPIQDVDGADPPAPTDVAKSPPATTGKPHSKFPGPESTAKQSFETPAHERYTGVMMYEDYYVVVVERVLKPFFFVCTVTSQAWP